jgi:hypothetical protein
VNQLKFDIDKETARGRPTNGAVLAHTPDEFLFDFVLAMPGQQPVIPEPPKRVLQPGVPSPDDGEDAN